MCCRFAGRDNHGSPNQLCTDGLDSHVQEGIGSRRISWLVDNKNLKVSASEAEQMINSGTAPAGLQVEGWLDFSAGGNVTLPEGLSVEYLDLSKSDVKQLPRELKSTVLDLSGCNHLESLPPGLVCRNLLASNTGISTVPSDLQVSNSLDLSDCQQLTELPPGLKCGTLNLRFCNTLQRLPEMLDVRHLDVSRCASLSEWPKSGSLRCGWLRATECINLRYLPGWIGPLSTVNLRDCINLESIEEGIEISSWIDLGGTAVKSLPRSLDNTQIRWKGVPITKRILQHPESITAREVLESTNIELRRVLLDRMGYERFFDETKAEILDQDTDAGGARLLLRVPMTGDEDLVCVQVDCPSTARRYVLRVPPRTTTCRQAVAWIAGFEDPDRYAPLVET